MVKKYIPVEIEAKWQKRWKETELYKVDLSKSDKKYYLLVEFTYPSGDLHMGHWFAFAVPDILARMKRMQGYNVFAPNGFDAFGLPAENAAIKRGIHPQDWTLENIKKMKEQFATMGAIYDWDHEVITCMPNYYKWNQWIFLKMFERGLAYRGKTLSNWCPKDQCVLANENVENGKCWRCGTEVEQRKVEQWFLKLTDYAEELLWNENNKKIDWPTSVKDGQNNWIGKSDGVEIHFKITDKEESIKVFTTRPDTIYGVTFLVLAPEHPIIPRIGGNWPDEKNYISRALLKSERSRLEGAKAKTGVKMRRLAINPVNGKEIPIYISDYVLMGYGTGAVMGVPGSDTRDFEFAKKFDLPIVKVITGKKGDMSEIKSIEGVLEEGFIVNSGQFDGLASPDPAKKKFMDFLEENGWGQRKVNYHLHDWSVSRQRYWGTPIPIIYCDNCGTVPVPEKDLPVELPYEVDYAPKGKPPLATAEDWVKVKCPKCGGDAKRETETMDTFVDSSWYFLRYLDSKNDKEIASREVLKKWMPVDIYFGGAEHTLGHTLYSRFFYKFLIKIGAIGPTSLKLRGASEYAAKRVHHGVILGPDGSRMSKSRGNVVNPDDEVKRFGADSVRMYLAFLGPYDLVAPWNPTGINGVYNFLQRVWKLAESVDKKQSIDHEDEIIMNRTIKKVGEDVEGIKFNTAVSALMEWLNHLSKKAHKGRVSWKEYEVLLKLLAPFAPHLTEELWNALGNGKSIHLENWPQFEEAKTRSKKITLVVQVNGKLRDRLPVETGISQQEAERLALESQRVQKYLGDKKPRKVVFVKDRLINLVG